jgi:hypothetical protein
MNVMRLAKGVREYVNENEWKQRLMMPVQMSRKKGSGSSGECGERICVYVCVACIWFVKKKRRGRRKRRREASPRHGFKYPHDWTPSRPIVPLFLPHFTHVHTLSLFFLGAKKRVMDHTQSSN